MLMVVTELSSSLLSLRAISSAWGGWLWAGVRTCRNLRWPGCCPFSLETSQRLCRGFIGAQLNFEEELQPCQTWRACGLCL